MFQIKRFYILTSIVTIGAIIASEPAHAALAERIPNIIPSLSVDMPNLRPPEKLGIPSEISGQIIDTTGEPLIGVYIIIEGTNSGTTTDIDGKFKLKVPNTATTVKISYVGMETQTLPINSVPAVITMKEDPISLNEVVITVCSRSALNALNAEDGIVSKTLNKCIPTSCKDNYELSSEEYLKDEDGEFELDDNDNKILVNAVCIDTNGRDCEPIPENAKIAKLENGKCIIKKCNEPQYRLIDGQCVDQVGKDCKAKIPHAVEASYQMKNGDLVCQAIKCDEPGWVPNAAATKCEESDGPCTESQIKAVANAVSGSLRKGRCIITSCASGYHPSDDGASCEQAQLSQENAKQKVADLKDNAQRMKDKEQSAANKMLGAASIATTGIGAMNLMSGLAEQNADDSAEEDMKAYLATFVCDFGQGRNIKGGERDIDLPGGNELFDAANEYKALAADLKTRKEALGKQPGIEAEVIYDIAETGLYDNVGMGRQSGAYVSVSRALMDETGEDAQAWAEQKQSAHDKKNDGLKLAAAGALGGLVGNLAINSGDKNKNKVDEINKKYDGLKQPIKQLEQNIQELPKPTQCPNGTTGAYPNCQCTNSNQIYSGNSGCMDCPDNEQPTANRQACECKAGYTRDETGTCKQLAPSVVPECETTDENMSVDPNTGACSCMNGFEKSATNPNECVCNSPKVEQGNQCIEPQPQQEITINENDFNISLSADTLFDLGKSDIKPGAYNAIGEFRGQFKIWRQNKPDAPYCIKITGHTDKTGTDRINMPLSRRRAAAVQQALVDDGSVIQQANTRTDGVGSSACQTPTKTSDENCRKVTIEFLTENCP